jgi:hypothetical protein
MLNSQHKEIGSRDQLNDQQDSATDEGLSETPNQGNNPTSQHLQRTDGMPGQHQQMEEGVLEPPQNVPLTESPVMIDSTTQEQGKQLHEVIRMFKEITTTPLSKFVLQTSKHKMQVLEEKIKRIMVSKIRGGGAPGSVLRAPRASLSSSCHKTWWQRNVGSSRRTRCWIA